MNNLKLVIRLILFIQTFKNLILLQIDGKLLFSQLPLVEYEGNNLVQSGSISRYFAGKGGLLGSNEQEKLK